MYKVTRNGTSVVIKDWADKLVYNVALDAYVLYRITAGGEATTQKVADLTDEQLLIALTNAIKLPL